MSRVAVQIDVATRRGYRVLTEGNGHSPWQGAQQSRGAIWAQPAWAVAQSAHGLFLAPEIVAD